MRRDLFIGALVSLLLHGGSVAYSEWLKDGVPHSLRQSEGPWRGCTLGPLEPAEEWELYETDDKNPPAYLPVALEGDRWSDVAFSFDPTAELSIRRYRLAPAVDPICTISICQALGCRLPAASKKDAVAPDHSPFIRKQVSPVYPFAMRSARIEGEVLVRVSVDGGGRVLAVSVVRSTDRGFEAATLDAVRHWHFQPARRNGQAVAANVEVPVAYRLADEGG